jgi:hypothetical protein
MRVDGLREVLRRTFQLHGQHRFSIRSVAWGQMKPEDLSVFASKGSSQSVPVLRLLALPLAEKGNFRPVIKSPSLASFSVIPTDATSGRV